MKNKVAKLLLASIASITIAGCGSMEITTSTSSGKEGEKIFIQLKCQSKQDINNFTIHFNAAHESASTEESAYVLYLSNERAIYACIYQTDLDFSTSEKYNAKDVKKYEAVPGIYTYSCSYADEGVDVKIDASYFKDESGELVFLFAPNKSSFSDISQYCNTSLNYKVKNDKVIIN